MKKRLFVCELNVLLRMRKDHNKPPKRFTSLTRALRQQYVC